ncbi:FAD-dependent monooxygenase [Nocardia jinanensis]|uniref:FAD-dependent oxidoreductase n=1 Tax=Nocardia jinanensis TaxID=382504 RepID=A0A917VY30_9NOCA|nr:FAD-dependent monooxygenase [Nocardia jinanensis]GGL33968.1 FAD-dependent oxidoreductase [Nocardia jinanensis]
MTTQPTPAALRVLISGGGIAGNAVALQLLRAGIRPTVVERAAVPRPGGQAVDLRGPSRTVAQRMGLAPGIRNYQLDERGMVYIDSTGREAARMPAELFEGNGAVAEIEITRGDLNQVLLDAIAEETARHGGSGIDYRYGEQIRALREHADGVSVEFASGATEEFDLVVGADGLHSTTRRLAFGPEEQFSTYLGGYTSYFTMPTPEGIRPHWMTVQLLPGGTFLGFRPDADPATTKVMISIRRPADPALRRDTAAQKQLLREGLAAGGRLVPEVDAAMDHAEDFYFDELARITMPQWTTERIALVGDAGYCGSPLSGQGTAMALVGAYVLVGEIMRTPGRPTAALARYNEILRPFVKSAQQLPPGGVKAMTPRTRAGIRASLALVRFTTSRLMRPLMTRMLSGTEDYALPDYSADLPAAEQGARPL